jgi:hypothetical protein
VTHIDVHDVMTATAAVMMMTMMMMVTRVLNSGSNP